MNSYIDLLKKALESLNYEHAKTILESIDSINLIDKNGNGIFQFITEKICEATGGYSVNAEKKFNDLSTEIEKLSEEKSKLKKQLEEIITSGAKNAKDKELKEKSVELDAKIQERKNLGDFINYKKVLDLISERDHRKFYINHKDATGKTPITIATEKGKPNAIEAILNCGADPAIGNQEGKNAFQDVLKIPKDNPDNTKDILDALSKFGAMPKVLTKKPKEKEVTKALESYLEQVFLGYKKTIEALEECSLGDGNFLHLAIKNQNIGAINWLDEFLNEKILDEKLNGILKQSLKEYCATLNLEDGQTQKISDKVKKSTKHNLDKFKSKLADCKKGFFTAPDLKGQVPSDYIARYAKDNKFIECILHADNFEGIIEESQSFSAECALYNNFDVLKVFRSGSQLDLENHVDTFCDQYARNSGTGQGRVVKNPHVLQQLVKFSDTAKNDDFLSTLIERGAVDPKDVLHFAIEEAKDDLAIKIIDKIADDTNLKDVLNKAKQNPLEAAILCGQGQIATKLLDHVNAADLINEFKVDESGKNILHLAAQNVPDTLSKILEKLGDKKQDLLSAKDKDGKVPAQLLKEYQRDNFKKLTNGLEDQDLDLYHNALSGNIDALNQKFKDNESNLYKSFQDKSILEVASDAKNANVVRLIIAKHNELQKKIQSLNGEIKELEIDIERLEEIINRNGAEETEKIYKENQKADKEKERDESSNTIENIKKSAQKTALSVLVNQKQEDWHKEVFDIAALEAAVIQNYIDVQKRNPISDALQNKNQFAADALHKVYGNAIGQSTENAKALTNLLAKNQDIDGLLRYGMPTDAAYKKVYKFEANTAVDQKQTDASQIFKDDLNQYKSALTQKINGKGILAKYANAISNNDDSGKNFKSALSGFKGKDKSLLNKSDDESTIATMIAAFGGILEWREYDNKYSSLEYRERRSLYACNDDTSPVGTPAQCVLLAKKLTQDKHEKDSRDLLFEYFVREEQIDIKAKNKYGQNIMHTISRCSDIKALRLILSKCEEQDIASAMMQEDINGKFPLQIAISQSEPEFAQIMMQGLSKNLSAKQMQSLLVKGNLLHTAVLYKNPVVQKFILALQKTLNIKADAQELHLEKQIDSKERDPFKLAVELNRQDAIDVFVQEGLLPEKDDLLGFLKKDGDINIETIEYLNQLGIVSTNDLNDIKNQRESSQIQQNQQQNNLANNDEQVQKGSETLALKLQDEDGDIVKSVENGNLKSWLTHKDIFDIANYHYNWQEKRFYSGGLDNLKGVLSDQDSDLVKSLKNLKDGDCMQYILNSQPKGHGKSGGDHWVTLVFAKQGGKIRSFYSDPNPHTQNRKGQVKQLIGDYKNLGLGEFIDCSNPNQQKDGYNCGVFALENAERIRSAIRLKKSDDQVKEVIKGYEPSDDNLNNLRRSFASAVYHEGKITNCSRLENKDQAFFKKESKSCYKIENNIEKEFNKKQKDFLAKVGNGSFAEAIEILSKSPEILTGSNCQSILDQILNSQNKNLILSAAEKFNHTLLDKNGDTFLHKIAKIQHKADLDITDICLKNGASLLAKNKSDKTALKLLEERINTDDTLKSLIDKEKGVQSKKCKKAINLLSNNLNSLDVSDRKITELAGFIKSNPKLTSPLVLSKIIEECFKKENESDEDITKKRFELLNKLVRKEIPLEETDELGNNILHQLCFGFANLDITKSHASDLIESISKNINFNDKLLFTKNADGVTPLEFLARGSNLEDVWQLIKEKYEGSSKDLIDKFNYQRLFEIAVSSGNSGLSEFFLNEHYEKINLDCMTENGDSLLFNAVCSGNLDLVKLLLKRGANINQCDQFGRNALSQLSDLLYKTNCNSNDQILSIKKEILDFLVESGIDLKSRDKGKKSTLEKLYALDDYKAQLKQRYEELKTKQKPTKKECNEIRFLKKSEKDFDIRYLELAQKAQETRQKKQEYIKKQVGKNLLKVADNQSKSILHSCLKYLPEFSSNAAYVDPKEFYTSFIGSELKVEVKSSAKLNVDSLLNIDSQITKCNLSFNNKRDTAIVEKHPKGPVNYKVTSGSLIVKTSVEIGGKVKDISVQVFSDGKIQIVKSDKNLDTKMQENLQKGKIDFSKNMIYVGGERLESALSQSKWKEQSLNSMDTEEMTEVADGLKGCGRQDFGLTNQTPGQNNARGQSIPCK